MPRLVLILALFVGMVWTPSAWAQQGPAGCGPGQAPDWAEYFQPLYGQLGQIMGAPTDCGQLSASNGLQYLVQHSTNGIAYMVPSVGLMGFVVPSSAGVPPTKFALAKDGLYVWDGDSLIPPDGTPVVNAAFCNNLPRSAGLTVLASCLALDLASLTAPEVATPSMISLLRYVVSELNDYWTRQFAAANKQYSSPNVMTFSGSVMTACGQDPGGSPFYCPRDATVYLDVSFLASFDTTNGDFPVAVVVAHETGHHVQRLFGVSKATLPRKPGQFFSIDVELQADCFAGAWGRYENNRGNLDPGDLPQALMAMYGVGDVVGTSPIDPSAHGAPAQRVQAFAIGYQSAGPGACWSM